MAAGDLIVARPSTDWPLVELRAVLMGVGTNFEIGPGPIGGLGSPPVRANDLELDHADGIQPGRDYFGPRTLTVPLLIHGSTPTAAMANLSSMRTVWARVTDGVDIQLHLQLPDMGHAYVTGRPRGIVEDAAGLKSGEIAGLGTFVTTASHLFVAYP